MNLNINRLSNATKTPTVLHHTKIIKSTHYSLSSTQELISLVERMMQVCLKYNGIGLAAPQIGKFKRIFIIRNFDNKLNLLDTFSMYINPTWIAVKEDGKEIDIEGCLSVPGEIYSVERWKTIDAEWWELEEEGLDSLIKKNERLSGYRARVFQHEFQHLNAVSIANIGTRIINTN